VSVLRILAAPALRTAVSTNRSDRARPEDCHRLHRRPPAGLPAWIGVSGGSPDPRQGRRRSKQVPELRGSGSASSFETKTAPDLVGFSYFFATS
jgi:hypothetical protein